MHYHGLHHPCRFVYHVAHRLPAARRTSVRDVSPSGAPPHANSGRVSVRSSCAIDMPHRYGSGQGGVYDRASLYCGAGAAAPPCARGEKAGVLGPRLGLGLLVDVWLSEAPLKVRLALSGHWAVAFVGW